MGSIWKHQVEDMRERQVDHGARGRLRRVRRLRRCFRRRLEPT